MLSEPNSLINSSLGSAFGFSPGISLAFGYISLSPAKFELSQNYPNPFNPVTTIKYVVPESGKIRLAVFNPLGEEVATLVDEFKEAGVHRVNFNASGLNSGVYVYQLSAGNFSQIRKMILVK